MSTEQLRILRFLIVGGFNTVFGYAVYATLLLLSGSSLVAVTGATLLGMVFNFFSYGIVVFHASGGASFDRFILVYFVIWLLNNGLLKVTDTFGVSEFYAQLFFIPILAAMSYLGMKCFAFSGSAAFHDISRSTGATRDPVERSK
jgi:putative flippase GtrA